ncbi:8052_t:CDS:2, partial [Scutellospora calospora]
YPTIAFIFLLITAIKYHYALDADINDNLEINNEKSKNLSESSNLSDCEENYWNNLSNICLLSILLDLQLKEIAFTSNEIHNDTICEYLYQLQLLDIQVFEILKELEFYNLLEESATSNSTRQFSKKMFEDIIFDTTHRLQYSIDKLDFYLNLKQTPLAS